MSDEAKKPAAPPAAYRFKPGQSGNPGGRVKGYERRLRECVDAMRADDPVPDVGEDGQPVLGKDGKPAQIPAFEAIVKQAVVDAVKGDRYARDFVADRLMGKPKVNVDIKPVTARRKADLSGMSTAEKRSLLTAYEAMKKLTGTEEPAPDEDAAPTEH